MYQRTSVGLDVYARSVVAAEIDAEANDETLTVAGDARGSSTAEPSSATPTVPLPVSAQPAPLMSTPPPPINRRRPTRRCR